MSSMCGVRRPSACCRTLLVESGRTARHVQQQKEWSPSLHLRERDTGQTAAVHDSREDRDAYERSQNCFSCRTPRSAALFRRVCQRFVTSTRALWLQIGKR